MFTTILIGLLVYSLVMLGLGLVWMQWFNEMERSDIRTQVDVEARQWPARSGSGVQSAYGNTP